MCSRPAAMEERSAWYCFDRIDIATTGKNFESPGRLLGYEWQHGWIRFAR